VEGGQHWQRLEEALLRAAAPGAQGFANLQAVQARQHQVEYQQITRRLGLRRQSRRTIRHRRDLVTRLGEVQHEQVADVGLVFGNQ
jgi:hypothetical protein